MQSPDPRATLPRGPAVELAQALVDRVAERAGIRVLALKGPVLAHHRLRAPRTSSDADVLVEPGRRADLQAALATRGWRVRFEREMPAILERHSVTLLHPDWPVDIDLHWYFPGLHADPDEVFAALWEHREQLTLAHQPVGCLDLVGSALVASVHCVRYPQNPGRQKELRQIQDRLADDQDALDRVVALARRTRAITVLRGVLVELGVDPGPDDLDRQERERWHRYVTTHEMGSTGAWLQGLSSGSAGHRIRTALRAVWPSRTELARMHPAGGPLTARQRVALRVTRFRRGLAALRPTLRNLGRSAKGR